jgi:hypothetical protein
MAVARAADVLATALFWGPEPVHTAITRCEGLLAEAEENELMRANVLAALAGLRALNGDFGKARHSQVAATKIYRDLGNSNLLAGLAEIAAEIERLAGNPGAAEVELRRGLDLLASEDRFASAQFQARLAGALVAQERHEGARVPAEAAREGVSAADIYGNVLWRGALAQVEAAAGSFDVARGLAREGADMAALTDGLAMRAEALLDLAAVLNAAGDTDEAARVEREAASLYELKGATR